MKYLALLALIGTVGLTLPALTSAATYSYVTTSGEVWTVEASSAEEAIRIAPDRHATSGVALEVTADVVDGDVSTDMTTYQYISVSGEVESVEARSAAEALVRAQAKATTSGVIMAESDPLPESMNVPL